MKRPSVDGNLTLPTHRRAWIRDMAAVATFASIPWRAKANVSGLTSEHRRAPSSGMHTTRNSVDCAVIQYSARLFDREDPDLSMRRVFGRTAQLMDEMAHFGPMPEILAFNAMPAAAQRPATPVAAIEVPGAETQALAARAKQYGVWLAFGCYAHSPRQTREGIALGVLIAPSGCIVSTRTLVDSAPQLPISWVSDDGGRRSVCFGPLPDLLVNLGKASGNQASTATATCYRIEAVPARKTAILEPNGTPCASAFGPHEEIVRATIEMGRLRSHRPGKII